MSQDKSRYSGEKILVADDEQVILDLSRLLLQKRGFEVLLAHNGVECVDMVAKHHPALVLLDYMMPVMNGLDALKQIHRDYPDTYVIMFTGKGSEEVAVELMKAGACDYIQKPFSNQNLRERIDSILALRQVELENRKLLRDKEFLQREIEEWNLELEQRVTIKSRELEQAQQSIIQAEKLAALGHISAGMAHEIRNPLNSINLFAQILSSASEIDPENQGYVKKIIQEVERIDTILIQMLAASKGDSKPQSQVDPSEILLKVLQDCRIQIEAQNVQVESEIADRIPKLKADPLEIEQIFTNLIGNALSEMPRGGCLGIVLTADAENLRLVISDTGKGIPTENLPRIFDPFFTTKEKGTGFGLSVVLRIVNGYGGSIKVQNLPQQGASFLVDLPLSVNLVH